MTLRLYIYRCVCMSVCVYVYDVKKMSLNYLFIYYINIKNNPTSETHEINIANYYFLNPLFVFQWCD